MTTISSICYHYLSRSDEFKDIRGHSFELFKKHIDFLNNTYEIINPQDLLENKLEEDKKYMLLTFDDGLKEHLKIAQHLSSLDLKAVFAIPSCILREEPANPQIIHFGLAYYGKEKFYQFIEDEVKNNFSKHENLLPTGEDKTVPNLKNLFKNLLDYKDGRQILLNIFKNTLQKDFPNFMDLVHLTKKEIKMISDLGHMISVHTDGHPVVPRINSNNELVEKEIVQSKKSLENVIDKKIETFAYPFGGESEVLDNPKNLSNSGYKLIFTTFKNSEDFNPLDFGRYCTFSQDSTDDLLNNLWHYKVNK